MPRLTEQSDWFTYDELMEVRNACRLALEAVRTFGSRQLVEVRLTSALQKVERILEDEHKRAAEVEAGPRWYKRGSVR